jgi:hypothetical protein
MQVFGGSVALHASLKVGSAGVPLQEYIHYLLGTCEVLRSALRGKARCADACVALRFAKASGNPGL